MPKAKLYNWDSIPSEVVRKGVSRKGFQGENMLLVMNRLEPGFEPRPHSHPFEQVIYIVSGKMRLHVGDEVMECGPGSLVRIPPKIEHYGEAIGTEPCMNLDVFAPVRKDYEHLVEYQKPDFL